MWENVGNSWIIRFSPYMYMSCPHVRCAYAYVSRACALYGWVSDCFYLRARCVGLRLRDNEKLDRG